MRHHAAFSADSLASDSHPRTLQDRGTSGQQAAAGACGAVIAEHIDAGATTSLATATTPSSCLKEEGGASVGAER